MRPVMMTLRALTVASTLLVGGEARAATTFNLAIPASACQVDGKNSSKLKLIDGSWTFGVGSGAVTLWCPVVHPYLDALTGEPQIIDAFRMSYSDSDGIQEKNSVTAQLFRRPVPGDALVPVSEVLSSDSSGAFGNARLSIDVADHTMLAEPYFFKVVLYRSSMGKTVSFTGLDIHDDGA